MERWASAIEMVPPQNLEAEQATLGSMMIDPGALLKGLELLNPDDFYRPNHSEIFEAMAHMAQNGVPVDMRTLPEELRKREQLDAEYLFALVESVPTAANVEHYAKIVLNKSLLRKLIAAGTELIGSAQQEDDTPQAILERHQQTIMNLTVRRGRDMRSVSDIAHEWYRGLQDIEDGKTPPRTPFALGSLTRIFKGGLRPGDLYIVGAGTSHGKSVVIADLLRGARKNLEPAALFSCEMPDTDYFSRLMCAEYRIDSDLLDSPGIPFDQVSKAMENLDKWDFKVQDYAPSMSELEAKLRRWALQHAKEGRAICAVDYAGLIKRARGVEHENAETGRIFQALKDLAMALKIKIITASQVRKQPATLRTGETPDTSAMTPWTAPYPKLEDLYGSQEISASADGVIILYNPQDAPCDDDGKRLAFMHIAKFRQGKPGAKFAVWFTPKYTRFDDCDMTFECCPPEPEQPRVRQWRQESWTQAYDS
jgi:replicative DNA helicase